MNTTLKTTGLGSFADAAAARGERVIEFGNGHWASFAAGARPSRPYWATALSKAQKPQVEADLDAIGRLEIGQSYMAVRGFHPRHGVKHATVTRVA